MPESFCAMSLNLGRTQTFCFTSNFAVSNFVPLVQKDVDNPSTSFLFSTSFFCFVVVVVQGNSNILKSHFNGKIMFQADISTMLIRFLNDVGKGSFLVPYAKYLN